MANIQFIGNVRQLYASKEAFDVHPQVKHKEQSAFPDQIKGLWFCVREGLFDYEKGREDAILFQVDKTISKPVPKSLVSVYDKGVKKVKDNFFRKLHECFPTVRKVTFNRVIDNREEEEGEDEDEEEDEAIVDE